MNQDFQENLKSQFGNAVRIGFDCDISPDLIVEIDAGGVLVRGDRVSIRRGCTLQVNRGATVVIGNDVAIGENTFISSMAVIVISDGVGISNMVDLHDHNHRDRSIGNMTQDQLTPWASGFAAAPIVIEPAAILSNKVSVTAGVRIGQNSIIGANSVVTRSIAPNVVAMGSPACVVRTFDAKLRKLESRQEVSFAWFGTSIMQHFEGFNERMVTQGALPEIGSQVEVESWRTAGYVRRLEHTLQARWPHVDIVFSNYGEGGATSRDILKIVQKKAEIKEPGYDVSILGCGLNDVWRIFQNRKTEAVDLREFTKNYQKIVNSLLKKSRRVICISETPFGWDASIDVDAANQMLMLYNNAAETIAKDARIDFINVWPNFVATARQFSISSGVDLWSDGVHMSDYGDAVLHDAVDAHIQSAGVLEKMVTYQVYDRDIALKAYKPLIDAIRTLNS